MKYVIYVFWNGETKQINFIYTRDEITKKSHFYFKNASNDKKIATILEHTEHFTKKLGEKFKNNVLKNV